jgi:hypothetical protein
MMMRAAASIENCSSSEREDRFAIAPDAAL